MTEPLREHPSTYIVADRSNLDELTRLSVQDKMITTGMGSVLPELADQGLLRRVLDVGCGTGGWLMETARTYPTIEKLVGVDVSGKMIEHARAQAESLGQGSRVRFRTMDALRAVDFPASSFDLVNQRFGMSWLRTWDWTKILVEYRRVCRPGGIIRIVETVNFATSSPAQRALATLALRAGHRAGHFFAPDYNGLANELLRFMPMHGIHNVQARTHSLVYRAGTEAGQCFYEDMARFYRVALPFFQKWTHVPGNYEEMYQQALIEMQQPDFVATMTLLTMWGTPGEDVLLMRGLR
jgi:ubiquinone/menaquinone biosynthesis C-methylase UbiE